MHLVFVLELTFLHGHSRDFLPVKDLPGLWSVREGPFPKKMEDFVFVPRMVPLPFQPLFLAMEMPFLLWSFLPFPHLFVGHGPADESRDLAAAARGENFCSFPFEENNEKSGRRRHRSPLSSPFPRGPFCSIGRGWDEAFFGQQILFCSFAL